MTTINPALNALGLTGASTLTGNKKAASTSSNLQFFSPTGGIQVSASPTNAQSVQPGLNLQAMKAGAQTLFDTQALAQSSAPSEDSDASATVNQFKNVMDSAHKGIGAFIRAQMLASKGLTEQSFAQLSPEDQQKINDEIRKQIEDAVKKQAEQEAAKMNIVV